MIDYLLSTRSEIVRARVFYESIAAIALSAFFWLWALEITISGDYEAGLLIRASSDDGLVCFPFVFVCGILGVVIIRQKILEASRALSCSVALSFLFTILVYLMSASLTDPNDRHLAYLLVSAFLWLIYGLYYYHDAELYRKSIIAAHSTSKLSEHLLDNV